VFASRDTATLAVKKPATGTVKFPSLTRSVSEPPRCRLPREPYIYARNRELGRHIPHCSSTRKTNKDDAVAKLKARPIFWRTPGNLPKKCNDPAANKSSLQLAKFPRPASWLWHPRRCAGAPTAAPSAASGRRATSLPARRAAGSFWS
jgi:hypothetical protein